MKNVVIVFFFLLSAITYGQKTAPLTSFNALESTLGAHITIIKATNNSLAYKGDEEKIEAIRWTIENKVLLLSSVVNTIDFKDVFITVYTSEIEGVILSNGGKLSMQEFNRIEDFTVSAAHGAHIDLSTISFKNLVAEAADNSTILYKTTRTLVSNSTTGGQVKATEGSRFL